MNLRAKACGMGSAIGNAVLQMGVDRLVAETYYLRSTMQGPAAAHAIGMQGRSIAPSDARDWRLACWLLPEAVFFGPGH